MTGDCCVFKFLQRSLDGKHLMHFQSETFVFRFLRRNVDGGLKSLQTRADVIGNPYNHWNFSNEVKGQNDK